MLKALVRVSAVLVFLTVLALNVAWAFRAPALRDFGSFWASGELARLGRNPYSANHPTVFRVEGSPAVNLNPPFSLWFFAALSWMAAWTAMTVFRCLSAVCYAASMALLIRHYTPQRPLPIVACAVIFTGFWSMIALGQIYAVLLLLVVTAWLLLEQGHAVWAGICLGLLAAIKPQFVLWPALLFIGGSRRAALAAALSWIVASASPLLWLGPEVYAQWSSLVAAQGPSSVFNNSSLQAITGRFGSPLPGFVLAGALILLATWIVWRRRPPSAAISSWAILLGLLAGPITWEGYTILAWPVIFAGSHHRCVRIATALLVSPMVIVRTIMGLTPALSAVGGGWYGYPLLLILADSLSQQLRLLPLPPAADVDAATAHCVRTRSAVQ